MGMFDVREKVDFVLIFDRIENYLLLKCLSYDVRSIVFFSWFF